MNRRLQMEEMVTETNPTETEWRKLYTVMDRVKEAAPWEFMDETELFGVQNPETGELGFVSVMGSLGEHFAVAVYLGEEGLAGFWELQFAGPYLTPDMVLNTPQLQASFEDRNELRQKDRDVIKKVGLKYRGKKAWPLFQSYAPGLVPWYLTAVEARFLTYALEQMLELITRLDDDPELLETDDDDEYLIRVPTRQGAEWVWHDEKRLIQSPESHSISIYLDKHALEVLQKLPPTVGTLDMDFFWTPVPVLGEQARPYYPYMLLLVEPRSGMILGNETMLAVPSMDEMWSSMPMKVGQILARLRLRPGFIRTTSEQVADYLEPLAENLNIEVQLLDELPDLDSAKEMLLSFLMRQ